MAHMYLGPKFIAGRSSGYAHDYPALPYVETQYTLFYTEELLASKVLETCPVPQNEIFTVPKLRGRHAGAFTRVAYKNDG